MRSSMHYRGRLLLVLAVVTVVALVLIIPDKRRTSAPLPPASVFDSQSAPYEYWDASGWREYTYVGRPVYQSRHDFQSIWSAGQDGCYVLTPAAEWDAVPELRDQVVATMDSFAKGTYSYDPETLADLPTFSSTCRPGQPSIAIEYMEMGSGLLGQANLYGTAIRLARADGDGWDSWAWCPSTEDGSCYQIGTILLHEMGHILGLAHSAPGSGPGAHLTIMSIEAPEWDGRSSPQFGQCDMAGLQARYGLEDPETKLSACLPPIGTRVTLTAVSGTPGRLAATLGLDPSMIPAGRTAVTWFQGNPSLTMQGHWETYGLDGQLVHPGAAVELWARDTSGGSVQDRRIGLMTFTDAVGQMWTIDVAVGAGATQYFGRFVGDGAMLADDSEPVSI